MTDAIQEGLATKLEPRKQPPQDETEGKADQNTTHPNLRRKPQNIQIRWCHFETHTRSNKTDSDGNFFSDPIGGSALNSCPIINVSN